MKRILPFLALSVLLSSCFIVKAIQEQPYSYVYRDLKTGKYDAGYSELFYNIGDTIEMCPQGRTIVITSRYKVFSKND